jgi:hypothetical protein
MRERHHAAWTAARPGLTSLFDEYADFPLVSISDQQRLPFLGANWQSTIYHGIPRNLDTFEKGGRYLAFLGALLQKSGWNRAFVLPSTLG